jgi:hypothetical protein
VQHDVGAVGERRGLRPWGRQQRVSLEPAPREDPGCVGERTGAEADQALAVDPGEVALG